MKRPNIIFIMVDQLHHKALSAYGNLYVKTPNLDRLVEEGTSFMKMHTIMPQCCPARAGWMTGRSSKEHGVVVNSCPINPKFPDLAQWLRKHSDYETVYTGKWHVPQRRPEKSFEQVLVHECGPFGELSDPAVSSSAVGYLRNRKKDRPLFMCVSFINPHDCCYTAGASGGLGKFGLADKLAGLLPPLPKNFVKGGHPLYRKKTKQWGPQGWQFYRYSYYRQVEMVDAEIGLVLDAVRNSSEADNTLIIFSSDHGDGLGFHGKVSKGFLEDEAWRVPAIVWGKGIPKNRRDEEHLAGSLDIPATITDYAGVPPLPQTRLGVSWRPLLEGGAVSEREYVVGETSVPYLGVAFRDRSGMKTIFYEDGTVDVFNTETDPLEMKNLKESPEAGEVLRRHRGYFADYLSKIDVSPIPTWGKLLPNLRKAYGYIDWYSKMKKELAS